MECGDAPWSKGSGHHTLTEYLVKYQEIHSYFKWTFVRNPYDRIASCWSSIYHVHSKKPERKSAAEWTPMILKYETLNDTFEAFLEMLYSEKEKLQNLDGFRCRSMPKLNMPSTRIHFFPMLAMLKHNGKLGMDFVGKVENMEQDWSKVCNAFGQEVPLRKLNTHRKKFGVDTSYDEMFHKRHVRDMVRELYKEDFEAFQYEAS